VTPPKLAITVRADDTIILDPYDCPSCGREIHGVRPPDPLTPAEQEAALTRVLPAQWFTVEPCGHEVFLALTVEARP
jgi:hypothetical protein